MKSNLSRRDFLKLGGAGLVTAMAATTVLTQASAGNASMRKNHALQPPLQMDHGEGLPGAGDVDHEKNGFNPGEVRRAQILRARMRGLSGRPARARASGREHALHGFVVR